MPPSLYAYIWQVSARSQIVLALFTVLVFSLAMVPLELQRRIIDDAIKGGDLDLLLRLGGAYLAVVLIHGGLKYLMNLQRGRVSERAIAGLRQAAYYCIYSVVPPRRWRREDDDAVDQGTVVSMLTAEVEKLGGFVGESLSTPLLQGGTMLVVLGYMIWLEPLVALIALALYSPQLVVVPLVQSRIDRRGKAHAERLRELGDFVVDHAESAGRSKEIPDQFGQLVDRLLGIRVSAFRLKFFLKFFNNFLGQLGPLSVLVVGGWLVLQGRSEVGTIVAFLSGFERISDPWRQLIGFYRRVADARMKYGLLVDAFPALPDDAEPPPVRGPQGESARV